MLTSNKIILETLSLLRNHGIHDFVLCPGSRNAGIVHSACQINDFRTHTATDERSAGFMAIGMALATQNAVAVIVTSGSALANLYPAACEAFYQHAPVIFISADRPASWIGQMDGQTMPQDGALGKMVKMSICLPEEDLWHANRLLNEAILCCKDRAPQGPVHINIPISEPIYDFTIKDLPDPRIIRLKDMNTVDLVSLFGNKDDDEQKTLAHDKTLLIIGQLHIHECPSHSCLREIAEHFTIIAESLSNLPPTLYTNPSQIDWDKVPNVDRVITLGGHIVSKELKTFFRTHRPKEHWHVSTDGAIADVFCCQTLAIKATTHEFLERLAKQSCNKHTPLVLSLRGDFKRDYRTEILERLFNTLPIDATVHLANSSSVRIAQKSMPAHRNGFPQIYCNRGINGIEGSLSTAVGFAMAKPEIPVYVVIGDLSFFYDQNALWHANLPKNLHILLFNDGRGDIFSTLPVPYSPQKSKEAITGIHNLSAELVARQYGLHYFSREEDLSEFIITNQPSILEIHERMENC